MTDNNNVIDELEYLMNPVMYEKWMKRKNTALQTTDLKSDIKFYKKRIIQLTKNMMKGEHVTNAVNKSYDGYMKSCIAYLKFLDTKDILQEEYIKLQEEDKQTKIEDIDKNIDNSLMNPTYLHKTNTITDYMNITTVSNAPKSETYLPEKKQLKLKDPQLKNKGVKKKIKKKKNIT